VVDGRDLDAVTDAVAALLSDRALRDRMGAAGRAWVETSWRWDVVAARLDELLQG
jgi:phosphatidylinositol alpha-1,6-mannosyltransferase